MARSSNAALEAHRNLMAIADQNNAATREQMIRLVADRLPENFYDMPSDVQDQVLNSLRDPTQEEQDKVFQNNAEQLAYQRKEAVKAAREARAAQGDVQPIPLTFDE